MSGHVMNSGAEVFSIVVTLETTPEDLAEVVEQAKAWQADYRQAEERRKAAQAAYDAVMAGESA